ncbi:MAG: DNA polymerase III subunit gamma/tau, partial [Luminiphilus sp.]|nr:DNA polymerase III subunit gamma/tau [Luminiphilus sp.]
MGYQVLARKWRPSAFDQMVGQEHVVKALTTALESDRLHHAYLFTGTRGVGKTTLARLLAKSLNCETGTTSSPCGQCSSCMEIAEGRSVDVLEVDAASRTKVEDTRDLLDNVQYAPSHSRFKIYLIDEVHMLSNHSFNALLKTLEEPPAHVKFLLATTDPQKLPATVLSRCLQFNLKNMLPDQIVDHLGHVLSEEGITHDADALSMLARAAEGSMRDALSLTDQAISHGGGSLTADNVRQMLGTVSKTKVLDLLDTVIGDDPSAALAAINDIATHSPDYRGTLDEFAAVLHQVTIAQMVPDSLEATIAERDRIIAIAASMTLDESQLWYQMALAGKRDLSLASDPRAGLDMAILRMIAFRPGVVLQDTEQAGAATPKKSDPPVLPVASDTASSEPSKTSFTGTSNDVGSADSSASRNAGAGQVSTGSRHSVDIETAETPPAPQTPIQPMELPDTAVGDVDTNTTSVDSSDRTPGESISDQDDTVAGEQSASTKASNAESVSLDVAADDLPTHASWCDFFEELQLKGVIHSVASHFELDFVSGRTLHFKIAEQNATLYNDRHNTSLAAAISEAAGDPVVVTVTVAPTGELTPFRQRELNERARVEAVEQALVNDEALAALLTEFD